MLILTSTFNPNAASVGWPCIADIGSGKINTKVPCLACEVEEACSEDCLAGRVNCSGFNVSVFHRGVCVKRGLNPLVGEFSGRPAKPHRLRRSQPGTFRSYRPAHRPIRFQGLDPSRQRRHVGGQLFLFSSFCVCVCFSELVNFLDPISLFLAHPVKVNIY